MFRREATTAVLLLGATFAVLAACTDPTTMSANDEGSEAGVPAPVVEAGVDAAPDAEAPVRVVCTAPETITALPDGGSSAPWTSVSPAKYQHGRCELVALLTDGAHDVRESMPGLSPVGIADLSQADGEIPGTDDGAPRHPAPSHSKGYSADVTYFRKDGRTLEDSPACPSKTREFCEGPHDVDVGPTALLLARIARTERVVQFIVDPVMEGDIGAELDRLGETGAEGAKAARKVLTSGVPFHADHFHVAVSRACYDGRDNDGDGKTDLDDPDCVDALDEAE